MVSIREIGADELFKIRDLAEEIWPPTFREILSSEQIRYMLNWMYDPETLIKQQTEGHCFFLAEEKDVQLGFMGIQLSNPDPTSLKIHKLYVLPELQGKGIGRKLVDKAVELAMTSNIDRILLNVNRYNKAVEFYKHIGFSILYEDNIDIGNDYWMEDYVMELTLH